MNKTEKMYNIARRPCYSEGTCNAPQHSMLKAGDYDPNAMTDLPENIRGLFVGLYYYDRIGDIVEMTKADAETFISWANSGTYNLAHGEMGRPDLEAIPVGEEFWGDDCYDATIFADGCGYGDFVCSADVNAIPDDLDDDEAYNTMDSLLDENVEWDKSKSDYDIYTASAETDKYRYTIVYCPKTIAISAKCGDDLSYLDWDNGAIFSKKI